MSKVNKHLKTALITLALTVGVFSIGSLVKGSTGEFVGCTPTTFEFPTQGHTINKTVGDYLIIRIRAGSCDTHADLQDFNTSLIDVDGANVPFQGGIIERRIELTEAGNDDTTGIKLDVRKVSPITGDDDKFLDDVAVTFKLTVSPNTTNTTQGGTTTQPGTVAGTGGTTTLQPCRTPQFVKPPANTVITGTSVIEVGDRTFYGTKIFAVSDGQKTWDLHESLSATRSWDTTGVPNGDYTVTVWARCKGADRQSTSDLAILPVKVTNPNPPTGVSEEPSSTIVYTTLSGEKITVKPALLAQPEYRAVISAVRNDSFKIQEVKPVAKSDGNNEKVLFKGTAKANAKYQLVVFSKPKELDFTADKDGNWQVELNESLAPGEHEAYVVLNDSKGKPVERSSVISFVVPTAEAANANQPQTVKETAQSRARYYAAYSGLVILAAMLGFFGIQAARRRGKAGQVYTPTPEPPAEE